MFERHVLGAEGLDDFRPHVAQQIEEAGARIDPEPQRQGVDEEAHHRFELRQRPAPHRRPDDHLGLPRQLVQQRRPGRQQCHEQRGPLAQADLAQPGGGRLRDRQPLRGAFAALHRRAWPIGRDVERVGRTGELGAPLFELAGELRAAHPVAMPHREIVVGHRRQRPLDAGVQGVHLFVEQIEGPAIPDDVMGHEEQHVVIGRQPVELHPEERRARQVERLGDVGGQSSGQLGVVGDVLDRQRGVDGVEHDLRRRVADGSDHGAQYRLTAHQLGDRPLHPADVQVAVQAMGRRHVEDGLAQLQLLEIPDALLHERQRGRRRAVAAGNPRRCGDVARRGAVEPPGEGRHRRMLEAGPHRHRAPERAGQLRGHLRDQQRVSAEGEEVVVDRHPRQGQCLEVGAGHDLFGRRAWRDRFTLSEGQSRGGRQRLAVDLAAAGQRHRR